VEYNEFRALYVQQHPASVPKEEDHQEMSEYPFWLKYAVLAMFISAALLSGVHTIPTVYESIPTSTMVSEAGRQAVSALSFVAVELAIFIGAYLLAKNSVFAFLVVLVSFAVAMTANLRSVSLALQGSDLITKVVTIALGIGAPLIALMAGKMFINIHKADRFASLRARQRYKEASEKFDGEVLDAWTKFQRKTSPRVSISSGHLSAPLSAGQLTDGQADGQRTTTGQGYTKRTDARTVVWDYLSSNPDAVTMNVRQLAELLGVGKSTVSDVQREYKSRSNGHESEQP